MKTGIINREGARRGAKLDQRITREGLARA